MDFECCERKKVGRITNQLKEEHPLRIQSVTWSHDSWPSRNICSQLTTNGTRQTCNWECVTTSRVTSAGTIRKYQTQFMHIASSTVSAPFCSFIRATMKLHLETSSHMRPRARRGLRHTRYMSVSDGLTCHFQRGFYGRGCLAVLVITSAALPPPRSGSTASAPRGAPPLLRGASGACSPEEECQHAADQHSPRGLHVCSSQPVCLSVTWGTKAVRGRVAWSCAAQQQRPVLPPWEC